MDIIKLHGMNFTGIHPLAISATFIFMQIVASNPIQSYLETADRLCAGCSVTINTIIEQNYFCFPNNPNAITFYGKVQGTSTNTSADIVRVIESLVQSPPSEYPIDSSAPVRIQTSSNGSCVPVDDTVIITTEVLSTLSTQEEEETTGTTGGTNKINSACCTLIFTFVFLALLSLQ